MPAFLRENARWLAGGFLLTLFSSYGQTFYIALSSGGIRGELGLSHGDFGWLYMFATLASAAHHAFRALIGVGSICGSARVAAAPRSARQPPGCRYSGGACRRAAAGSPGPTS